ncbi:hypothetical protein [Spirillospora sp. NPDC048819]|uniref:DUF6891 domain-containing protein n=1 Tax=Spirillospora sp. NPDC048819 TaxID=3155268 RepID=UPI0033DE3A88
MTDNSDESVLLDHARFLVALGDHDFESVVQQCTEILDDPSEASERLARRIVGEHFAAHLTEQETWPDELDTDRLHRAFRELDVSGIVARLDHTCCQNCGISEIGGEIPADEERRGYVFAHRQDMEAAVPGGGLTLSYGVRSRGDQPPEAQAGIGEEVAGALRRHGLTVDWNGSPKRRIDVSLTWRRRRFGPLAAWPGGEPDSSDRPLSVSYCDMPRGGVQNAWVPVSFPQARDVLLTVAPYKGNYINFMIPSGGGLIASWGPGPDLTFELPGDEESARHVTIAEAEEIVSVLAHEGRVALP